MNNTLQSLKYKINNGSFLTPQNIRQYAYKKSDGSIYIDPGFSKEFGRKFFSFISFIPENQTNNLPTHHTLHSRRSLSNSTNSFSDPQFQNTIFDECVFFVESATLVCLLNFPEIPIEHLLAQTLSVLNFICCTSQKNVYPIFHKQIFTACLSIAFKLDRDQTIPTQQLLNFLNINNAVEITPKEILAIENQITQAFHISNISIYSYVECVRPWFEKGRMGINDSDKRYHLASLILSLVELNPTLFKSSYSNQSSENM